MLEHLSVKDFALLDSVEIDLPEGLILFTGETGAGKSLIVGAIGFLFGDKADQGLIREGAHECSVAGILTLENQERAIQWLDSREIDSDEGRVVLRRGLKDNGRSYAYIQGQPVSRGDLEEFTSLVADIHGQHEHQKLMDASRHLFMLDSFGGLEGERKEFSEIYDEYLSISRELKFAIDEAEQREQRIEALEYSILDIEKSRIYENEDEELAAEERVLSQHEKLFQAISSVSLALSGSGDDGLLHDLRRVKSEFETAKSIDSRLNDLATRLDSTFFELEDVSATIQAYVEKLQFDPLRLEQIENRLAELRRLKKKYGQTLSAVLKKLASDKDALAELRDSQDRIEELRQKKETVRETIKAMSQSLSDKRRSAGKDFSLRVNSIIRSMGMPFAEFSVCFLSAAEGEKPYIGENGADRVEFFLASNPGEQSKPLVKIASGGELSRIALAIKSVLAAGDDVETMIFDEIDTGIGGEVAVSVSSHLKKLSASKQILCVTHLAILAAGASSQFKVEKRVIEGRTSTKIEKVEGAARESEIARMLSGDNNRAASLAHAVDLLNRFSPTH